MISKKFLVFFGYYMFIMLAFVFGVILYRLFAYGWFENVSIFTLAFYSVPTVVFIILWFSGYRNFIEWTKK